MKRRPFDPEIAGGDVRLALGVSLLLVWTAALAAGGPGSLFSQAAFWLSAAVVIVGAAIAGVTLVTLLVSLAALALQSYRAASPARLGAKPVGRVQHPAWPAFAPFPQSSLRRGR